MELPSVQSGLDLIKGAWTRSTPTTPVDVVLTIRLHFPAEGPVVLFEVATTAKEAPNIEGTEWRLPYASICPDADGKWRIPPSVAEGVQVRMPADAAPQVLWLNLARPYGWLGTAPWESVIGEALGCTVLRLPDFPQQPAQRADVLETALIVDPGPNVPANEIVGRVRAIVDAVVRSSTRTVTRVHVFSAASSYPALKPLADPSHVFVHDPRDVKTSAEAYREAMTTSSQVPRAAAWVIWVASIIGGRGLDALHLLVRSTQHESGADLLLSCSPSHREEPYSTVVDSAELRLLLERAGAWAISFAPVSASHEAGVAYIADSFAHERPGAVFYHSMNGARAAEETLSAFRMLFGRKGVSLTRLRDGFLHVHPEVVRAASSIGSSEVFAILAEQAALLAQRAPVSERLLNLVTRAIPLVATSVPSAPPGWIGATQRFLESEMFDEVRRKSTDVLLSKLPGRHKLAPETLNDLNIKTNDVLLDIQNVVSTYLKTQKD
jgi:hypothetical protein